MPRAQDPRSCRVDVDELLARSPWFRQVSPAAQQRVRADTGERTLQAGQALGRYGEMQHAWYGVLEGLLKWSLPDAAGRSVTLGGQSAGSWFGEGTLLRGQPRMADLTALRPTRVALLPLDTFEALRRSEPGFDAFLLQQINERLHWFMDNFAAYRLGNAEQLVARALLGLVHPLLNPWGIRLLQVSQDELAALATVSRQRCNQSLATLKAAGVVEVEYGAIRIVDAQGLRRAAG